MHLRVRISMSPSAVLYQPIKFGMVQAPNNIVKPYTEVQKSPDIPNEEEHENMVSVLGRFVGPLFTRFLIDAERSSQDS